MHKNINIWEDFYPPEQFGLMNLNAKMLTYDATWQPSGIWYPNRLKAYPVYETKKFNDSSEMKNIFINLFEKVSNLKIKECNTFFRKILTEEMEKSPLAKYGVQPHRDNEADNIWDVAGVVYFNSFSLDDGTRLFSYSGQNEPDIIVGAKPNRIVWYDANLLHSPGHDFLTPERIIQPFFIRLIK